MIDCIEGAIVLHAGPYRQWLGSHQNPTIYTKENNYHTVDFKKFYPDDFIPIRAGEVHTGELKKLPSTSGIKLASTLLDSNGNPGNSGEVLTSTGAGSAPIWHPVGGGSGGVQKGSVSTNSNGDATVGFSAGTFPSGYTPTIVCTAHDTSGRAITAVVTSSSNTGFTVKTFIAGSHQHKVGQVYNTTTNPIAIGKSGKHHHYAVGTTGTTSHRHGIPNQGDHSHGLTFTPQLSPWTSSNGTQAHQHQYYIGTMPSNTNNGGSHNHGGNTDYETAHAHTYSTTTSGSGNTTQDADAEHTHTFSQIPAYMRETVMYTQGGSQHSIGATMTTQQQTNQVTELYTVSTVNTPIAILVNWIAI
jgi:hypothetical protein